MNNNANVIRVPTSIEGKFFVYWVQFLHPTHKLSNKEEEVLAALLKERFRLSQVISDETILNKVLFSDETKKKITADLNSRDYIFNNVLSKLRKKGVVVDNAINTKLIPNIANDTSNFKLIIHFTLDEPRKADK